MWIANRTGRMRVSHESVSRMPFLYPNQMLCVFSLTCSLLGADSPPLQATFKVTPAFDHAGDNLEREIPMRHTTLHLARCSSLWPI
ncbi:hypothetical protein ACTXT7_003890 [Hymenolepis weldensis]